MQEHKERNSTHRERQKYFFIFTDSKICNLLGMKDNTNSRITLVNKNISFRILILRTITFIFDCVSDIKMNCNACKRSFMVIQYTDSFDKSKFLTLTEINL